MVVDAARLFHAETRRFELAQIVTLDGKAKYWGDRAAFFQTRGHLLADEELAEAALKVQVGRDLKVQQHSVKPWLTKPPR